MTQQCVLIHAGDAAEGSTESAAYVVQEDVTELPELDALPHLQAETLT